MDEPARRGRMALPAAVGAFVAAALAWAVPAGADAGSPPEVTQAAAASRGDDLIAPAGVIARSKEIPVAEPEESSPPPGASISFVGPFGADESLEWPEEVTELMSCMAGHGVTELPQSHDEVVALWEKHRSGEHYVYRDGGVHFELSDPVVGSAYESCGGSRL
jgi:hypothetical protein